MEAQSSEGEAMRRALILLASIAFAVGGCFAAAGINDGSLRFDAWPEVVLALAMLALLRLAWWLIVNE